jgi:hypothetical protein
LGKLAVELELCIIVKSLSLADQLRIVGRNIAMSGGVVHHRIKR